MISCSATCVTSPSLAATCGSGGALYGKAFPRALARAFRATTAAEAAAAAIAAASFSSRSAFAAAAAAAAAAADASSAADISSPVLRLSPPVVPGDFLGTICSCARRSLTTSTSSTPSTVMVKKPWPLLRTVPRRPSGRKTPRPIKAFGDVAAAGRGEPSPNVPEDAAGESLASGGLRGCRTVLRISSSLESSESSESTESTAHRFSVAPAFCGDRDDGLPLPSSSMGVSCVPRNFSVLPRFISIVKNP